MILWSLAIASHASFRRDLDRLQSGESGFRSICSISSSGMELIQTHSFESGLELAPQLCEDDPQETRSAAFCRVFGY